MKPQFAVLSNYESIRDKNPKFRILERGVPGDAKPKGDIDLTLCQSPADLPQHYRFDGLEYVPDSPTTWTGVPYNLADDIGKRELHTAWFRLQDNRLEIFLGSRMVAFTVCVHQDRKTDE